MNVTEPAPFDYNIFLNKNQDLQSHPGLPKLGMAQGNIYVIESSSRQDLASMFMRFQEYYESPEFKGRAFTVDEFAHWYASKYGSFSYTKDWYGFNIPATVLEPFRNGDFNPLMPNEKKLLEICQNAKPGSYIVGVTPKADYFKETVQHEFVHGAFYVNQEYQKEVADCIKFNNVLPIKRCLSRMGYHSDVALDETNAYVLVEPDTIQEYVSISNTKKLRDQLDKIFFKHFGFSVLKTNLASLMARTEHVLI